MDASPPLPEGMTEVILGNAGLRGWRIATEACDALVSAQGAQLLAFQARGKDPLLWLSAQAAYTPGKAIRGGIPLCFPWFGPHPTDPDKPAHGFARQREWTLASATLNGDVLELELQLGADTATRALWPHDFLATLRMSLGRTLSLQLSVTNTGRHDFHFSFAFHSYFPLADSREARVEGLEGSTFIDQLRAGLDRQRQHGPVHFDGETDRIFLHTAGRCRLVDEVRDRALGISAPNCRSVIAWNPGAAKTARFGDMAPEAWRGMACVESGNIEDDAVTLPAGAAKAFTLAFEQEA